MLTLAVPAAARAAATATLQPLVPGYSHTAWFGGTAPRVTRVDVKGEFRDPATDRIYLRTSAVVQRFSGDRNGRIVMLRARNWREAFDSLDQAVSAKTGIGRGFTRDSIVKTMGYTDAELARPFPDLTARVTYDVFFAPQGENPQPDTGASKRALTPSTFSVALSRGVPPGTHQIGVIGCFWPDESHPMAKPLSWLTRGALAAGDLKDVATAVGTASAGHPVLAAGALLAKQAVQALGKSFAVTVVTCASSSAALTSTTTVPNVVGLGDEDATRLLRARWLTPAADPDIETRASCAGYAPRVVGQSPTGGSPAARDSTVTVVSRHCVATSASVAGACDPQNPWHGTWKRVEHEGTVRIVQRGGTVQQATWSWFGKTGQFDQLSLEGRKLSGRDPGQSTFAITVSDDGKRFDGTYTWLSRPGTGGFSGTRQSCDA